ncbi:MAG TPA: YHS domain-containing (seleno)protein [Cyclobacteriaceae bacterium]|nr:YHS domain-containing (seleno)protein [Cyclobacteriaceae bacterium]
MKTVLTLLAVCLCLHGFAQENALRRRNFNHDNGVAMRDFDPVSYFKGKPTKGTSNFSYMYKSIEYYFTTKETMEEFKKTPAKYEPAYGGWCAYSMAEGKKVKIDPLTYKIINGKLYLFSNFNGNNTMLRWNKDEKKFKAAADKNWTKNMN